MKAKNLKKERQRERDRAFEYENTSIWILGLGVMCLFFPQVKGSNTEWGCGVGKGVFYCFLVLCLGNWTLVRNGLLCVKLSLICLLEGCEIILRGLREGKGEGSTKQKFIMIARINDFLFSNNFLKKRGKKKQKSSLGCWRLKQKFWAFG